METKPGWMQSREQFRCESGVAALKPKVTIR